jgi:hypothetical protein
MLFPILLRFKRATDRRDRRTARPVEGAGLRRASAPDCVQALVSRRARAADRWERGLHSPYLGRANLEGSMRYLHLAR